MDVTNHAQALVGRNASTAADGRIDVTALTDTQLASVSGAPRIGAPAGADGVPVTFGVDGSYQQLSLDTSADAHVEDGARVRSVAGVAVVGTERTALLANNNRSGAADFGVAGALTLVVGTTQALGYLEDGARVVTAGDLVIGASNDTVVVATGTLNQDGGPIAIGAGAIVISARLELSVATPTAAPHPNPPRPCRASTPAATSWCRPTRLCWWPVSGRRPSTRRQLDRPTSRTSWPCSPPSRHRLSSPATRSPAG